MKTINEKAREYAAEYNGSGFANEIACAYLAGATDALQSQWRSVEEELPKEGQDVLIAYISDIAETYFDIAWRCEYGEWYSVTSEHGYPIDTPTHWLPIPKYEPKKKKE